MAIDLICYGEVSGSIDIVVAGLDIDIENDVASLYLWFITGHNVMN